MALLLEPPASDVRPTPLDGEGDAPAPAAEPLKRLRVCVAASGGGHLRQLIDLKPVWSAHDYCFVTEDTALSQSLAAEHPVHFVPHFALGQAKLGAPLSMLLSGIRNLWKSAQIMARIRPQVVITTGAGAVYFAILWARLFGAKLVVVESFARFDRPSLFGRLAAPFAHEKVVQSPALSAYWPDAAVFDPLRIIDKPRPKKEHLAFATVGAILSFDRLVCMVAAAKASGALPERVIAQTGAGGAAPDGIDSVETLPFEEMKQVLRAADIVVCHGGTGSLITALREGCRVIAVPRLFELGEVYDDHQAEIVSAFKARGLIERADTTEELLEALARVRARPPVLATTDTSALADHLNALLSGWVRRRAAPKD